MKYRPLDAAGDYVVGKPFLSNSPETVAQAIRTRLNLWRQEFFLDRTDGTPYQEEVLGKRTARSPDAAIKQRILGTPSVSAITAFVSNYDADTRALTISASVDTAYGPISINEVL